MEEIWKPVVGYEWIYKISNLWNVYTEKYRKIRKPWNSNWYLRVDLWKDWTCKNRLIHRLVAEAFIFRDNEVLEVNHKNGLKHDNRVGNLEWVTRSENQKHAIHTLWKKVLKWKEHPMYWKRIPNSYFITKNIESIKLHPEIYEKIKSWIWPYILAKEYKLSPQTIYNIKYKYEKSPQSI